jgi:hypothetical protein
MELVVNIILMCDQKLMIFTWLNAYIYYILFLLQFQQSTRKLCVVRDKPSKCAVNDPSCSYQLTHAR